MPFRIIVVLIGAVATSIFAAIYPYLGLLALEFLTFGRPQDDRPNITDLHIPLLISIAIMVGLLVRLHSSGPAILAALKRSWIMLVLYVLMVLSAVANGWTPLSAGRLYDFTTLIFLCVATLALAGTEKRLRGYVAMLLASGAYVALRVIQNPSYIHEEISGEQFDRLSIAKGATVFGNSNYLALWMLMIIFLSIALMAFYRSAWRRAGLLALAGSAGYVFFGANSRGASIALAVAGFVLWLMQKRKLKATIIALVLVGVVSLLAPQSYWNRLDTISHYHEDSSATGRLDLWNIALDLIAKNPILGVGPENFVLYARNTPHDAYLQIGSEVGLPALLVYIGMLLSGLYAALRTRMLSSPDDEKTNYLHAVSPGVFCCIVAVVVQGFTTGLAHREVVYVFVTLAFCILTHARSAQAANATLRPVPADEPFVEPSLWPTP